MKISITIVALAAVLTLSGVSPNKVYAWGANGHRITAEIAVEFDLICTS